MTTTEASRLAPLTGPQVWYGPDLAARSDWIRPLTAAEITELEAAVKRLDATGIDIADIGPSTKRTSGFRHDHPPGDD